jgi:hypothetical protein
MIDILIWISGRSWIYIRQNLKDDCQIEGVVRARDCASCINALEKEDDVRVRVNFQHIP